MKPTQTFAQIFMLGDFPANSKNSHAFVFTLLGQTVTRSMGYKKHLYKKHSLISRKSQKRSLVFLRKLRNNQILAVQGTRVSFMKVRNTFMRQGEQQLMTALKTEQETEKKCANMYFVNFLVLVKRNRLSQFSKKIRNNQ